MQESIEWLRLLIVNHRSLEYVIIFAGTAVGGELALFILGFLAAQHIVSFIPSVIISLLGAFLPNAIWYALGANHTMDNISSHGRTSATFSIITEAVTRISRGSHLWALIMIKFLVGTPVILIMYANKTALSWRQFMYYQSVATFLSILIIMPLGYVSGQGFSYLTGVFENLYAAIGFLVLVAFIIALFQIWIEKVFTKTGN